VRQRPNLRLMPRTAPRRRHLGRVRADPTPPEGRQFPGYQADSHADSRTSDRNQNSRGRRFRIIATMTGPGGHARRGAWAGWVFPLLLLGFAAFFLGGRIGWWSDDYWHCQLDPVTGAREGLTIRRGFFLRPLF